MDLIIFPGQKIFQTTLESKQIFNKNLNSNLLKVFLAYSNGYFPMGKNKNNNEIQWVRPYKRGIIPVGKLYCSKSLRKFIKKNEYDISFNKNFNDDGERISDDKDERQKEFIKFAEEIEWYANALKTARNQ